MAEQPDRRTFLTGAGAAALAGLTAACASDASGPPDDAIAEPTSAAELAAASEPAIEEAPGPQPVAFRSTRQLGVLAPPQPSGLVAAFDVAVDSHDALAATLQDLSAEIERIMGGGPPVESEGFLPPVDSGVVDSSTSTTGIAITLAVGSSLFDDRFGLADRRPRELIVMPTFFNDRLVRPELSNGDLALTIAGPSQQAVTYALQQIVRVSDRRLQLRWVQDGYNELLPPGPERIAPVRNLMGFRDGTSNLDTTDESVMERHVWVSAIDDEPGWAVGGTYQAVRTIRMLIEFWATAALVRQEQIFGRHRDSGAPLGQTSEGEEPIFAATRSDEGVPRRSHIRLANPRTPDAARILRRGFSYANGADLETGTLDQGLLFMCFQRSLTRGFLEVQSRLEGEPLEDYVKPVGGGLFFALPGPGTGPDGWLGESLLT
ncbi:MAG: Dyp-type peroxidase [Actinomycetota bacterium]